MPRVTGEPVSVLAAIRSASSSRPSAEEADAEEEEGAEEPEPERDEARELIERRHRERAARRRRLGLGPGTATPSPFIGMPGRTDETWLDREIELIGRALVEGGEARRDELARRVGARYWGPGRFRVALREAVAEGYAERIGRNHFRAGPNAPQPAGAGAEESS
jgi:hypothetical protein